MLESSWVRLSWLLPHRAHCSMAESQQHADRNLTHLANGPDSHRRVGV